MQKKLVHKERKILLQKIADILKDKHDIIFAYIFGSFSDEAADFNDIDIGVYVSGNERESLLQVEFEIERELEDRIHIPFDVRIINRTPLSFAYQIIKSGIIIVDKNRNLRADFEGLTCKKYFDFQHLRNEYLREIVNAPI